MTSERAEFIKSLAQEIRRVDGRHDLGADALAEALMPWIESQAVAGEPYGYEFWVSNGDGTRSQEFSRKLPERHCADWGVTKLYTTPQPTCAKAKFVKSLAANWRRNGIVPTMFVNELDEAISADKAVAGEAEGATGRYVRWHPEHGFQWERIDKTDIGDDLQLGWKSLQLYTAPQPAPVDAAVEKDAARWRALIRSARVRFIGGAGLHSTKDCYGNPYNGYAHISMDFWTQYDGSDAEQNDASVELLTKYADTALAAQQQETRG